MLPRQARRNLAVHRSLLSSAPRYATTRTFERTVITTHNRPWRRRISVGEKKDRSLATAVGDVYLNQHSFANPPIPPPFQSTQIPAFDISSFVTIPEPDPKDIKPAVKMNIHGIVGETDELLSIFDACMRVGKLDRASLVLQRINRSPNFSGEEKIVLNNEYFRTTIQQLRSAPNPKKAEELHKWYELQVRAAGLPHTAETVAMMLKASLMCARGTRMNRLVTRYMSMVPGPMGLRVLSMADILSDADLAVITDICPTYNFVAGPEEVEEDVSTQVDNEASASTDMPEIPELMATPQKGQSLESVIKSLEYLSGMPDTDISKLTMAEQRQIQVQLERDSIDAALAKWRVANENMQKIGINSGLGMASNSEESLTQHLAAWVQVMVKRIKEEFLLIEKAELKAGKSDLDLERAAYGPLLVQSSPDRLAAITILSTLNLSSMSGADKGIAVSRLVAQIGRYVQEDIITQLRDKEQKEKRRQRKMKLKRGSKNVEPNKIDSITVTVLKEEPSKDILRESTMRPWSMGVKASVGAILLKVLVETTKIKVTAPNPAGGDKIVQAHPAFTHNFQVRHGKKVGVVLLNPKLVQRMMSEPLGDYLAKHLPMVVEPKPWKGMSDGGYLEGKTALVRIKPGDIEQGLYAKEAIKAGDMRQVRKGLDVLGKTGWRINSDVLRVMTEAWNTGDAVAGLPPLNPQFTIPPEPDQIEDPNGYRQWKTAVQKIENERSGLHSQRCFLNLQLEIARSFRGQTMYFPHNVDYRGRAYPIPTYLNHMGADETRGLLVFAKGKPLGQRGLRWLKIHLANVYGLDKASFDDREAFATNSIDKIRDSVNAPFTGSRWWLEAEDPWQCLAACFELTNALKLEDPTQYESHLPVQQDGTCNGLQHYAALGGDTWGAQQVNLEPGDKPADVYSAVADLVKQAITKDAEAGDKLAKLLEGKITRKVVKQTVMTNVYGVTFEGAKKQVCKQLDAIYPKMGEDNGTTNMILARYVAKNIFTSLATMFRGAHDIQYWLGEVGGRVCRALTVSQLNQIAEDYAKETPVIKRAGRPQSWNASGVDEIAKKFRSTVVWTTPLRMPVVQPYRKVTSKELKTCIQSIFYNTSDQTDPVNRKKQLQGFPPNFIHSLDASHMLLSALECHKQGLTFAAVHDSFWTHAGDVDTMNTVLRDAFIKIHEDDVIGRLAAEFNARHRGSLYLKQIDADTPVAKKIIELRKKSTMSVRDELLLEHKRNTLRLSGIPWDAEAAKQIVTPASVYEDMQANEVDLGTQDDVGDVGLGVIPGNGKEDVEVKSKVHADEAEDAAEMNGAAAEDEDVEVVQVKSTSAAAKKKKWVSLWLPLTIPTIPKKGDFKVERLRGSKYFFS